MQVWKMGLYSFDFETSTVNATKMQVHGCHYAAKVRHPVYLAFDKKKSLS